MSEKELLYEVRDGVAWLTLNREKQANAISLMLIDLFNQYLDIIEKDDTIHALCITGAGDRSFCAGADLGMGSQMAQGARKYAQLISRLRQYPRPILARLNGHCMAGGMGLMLVCDIVYASEQVKIGTPEVKVGLFPMMISALIFPNSIRKKALEMIYTAQLISAFEAEQMGLITRVYPDNQSMDEAVDKSLRSICSHAPLAMRIGRQALAEVEEMKQDEALAYLCDKLVELLNTEDAREGLAAFFEKREPKWKCR